MQSVNYSVHDAVTFKITTEDKHALSKLGKYSHFETGQKLDNYDIRLNIGEFSALNSGSEIVANKYFIKDNYFYCSENGKNNKWKIEINGVDSNETIINYDGKIKGPMKSFSILNLAENLLLPFIEYKLSGKNYQFLHAGAISKNSNAIILAGLTKEIVKPVAQLLIEEKDFNSMGDNVVIIKENSVLCFPSNSGYDNYKFKILRYNTEKLKHYLKYNCAFKKNEATNYHLEIAARSKINSIFLISECKIKELSITQISVESAIKKLILNNKAKYISSIPLFPCTEIYRYALIYSIFNRNSGLTNYYRRMHEALSRSFNGIPVYSLQIPSHFEINDSQQILDIINV
jgi:hypothetical protein